MKVIAVIPAFNEETQIGSVVGSVRPFVSEIIVIDDGSRDGTAREAGKAGAVVLRHLINRGQGAALATGTACARLRGADIVVHFDADGQQNPAEIKTMVQPIIEGKADVVIGSRFLSKENQVPKLRRQLMRLAILFTWFISGLKLTDAHNGFRALSRMAAEKINISQDRQSHASEILDEISKHRLRWVERPVTVKYTAYSMAKGQSNFTAVMSGKDFLLAKLFRK